MSHPVFQLTPAQTRNYVSLVERLDSEENAQVELDHCYDLFSVRFLDQPSLVYSFSSFKEFASFANSILPKIN